MRVAIASRIFEPEPSAASFRLGALASGFAGTGAEVRVLTVRPVPALRAGRGAAGDDHRPYRVTRFPVLRDRSGYVRGYLQYLSFDVPLFFRILCGPKQDAIVVEPPPTTAFSATLAAGIRRIPVFAYAADVWSDASESTGAPRPVVGLVRWMERFAWTRARGVYSVNDGVSARVREIAPRANIETVGNGIDTEVFSSEGPVAPEALERAGGEAYAIYTGTASEWQGAEIFVRAVSELQRRGVPLRLIFLGQGTALPELERLATELGARVEFHGPVPPEQAAAWQRGAAVSVASIRPGAGYDFAYPTKIFAAWGCGTPVVYAGPGPARSVLAEHPDLGCGVDFDASAVADALHRIAFLEEPSRERISTWARANVSLAGVADRAVRFTRERLAADRNSR
ncbi:MULTISPECIES: glycosyltransferase family 4 protein [unclassified Leucobacter]|uniref:glycosyltransferase family 4 protein n=1 Tax=unclassified Leucobacter TaxID=2621730 RepID=UPI00069B5553|nr:glycosyltransferase family 4 protein [Leucobacter sp. Ag1]